MLPYIFLILFLSPPLKRPARRRAVSPFPILQHFPKKIITGRNKIRSSYLRRVF